MIFSPGKISTLADLFCSKAISKLWEHDKYGTLKTETTISIPTAIFANLYVSEFRWRPIKQYHS